MTEQEEIAYQLELKRAKLGVLECDRILEIYRDPTVAPEDKPSIETLKAAVNKRLQDKRRIDAAINAQPQPQPKIQRIDLSAPRIRDIR